MSGVPQPIGKRGSLKWIQRAVNERHSVLDEPIQAAIAGAGSIHWLSPIKANDYAEYRDADFLRLLGVEELVEPLTAFWPRRGPQWDALGKTERGDLLLVEAKAHIREMFSPPSQASPESMALIEKALAKTIDGVRANPKAPWSQCFYQYANRLAHLAFLRSHGKPAWLVLVSFIRDNDPKLKCPKTAEAWEAAYQVMDYVLGLSADHGLARYIIHIYPDVADLQ